MTMPDVDTKSRAMYFNKRYISTGFEFGDKQINISDSARKMDFQLRKRVPEDGPVPPFEAGDGFISVTCTREMAERIYSETVSSGQLSVKNGAIRNLSSEMYKYVLRTMRLIRWRTNSHGRPNPIRSSFYDGFKWSFDGTEWKPVADCISFKASVTVNPQWTSQAEKFVVAETSGELDEPFGHELLREAWANRVANPRSSIVLAVAAAEVGFKQFASQAFPDTAWILENVPSPPLVRMLSELFPWDRLKLQTGEKKAKPPDSLTGILKKAVFLRDEIVHRGLKTLTSETVDSVLNSVRDLLYFLDVLQGQKWALNYLSIDCRNSFV
jgi:hypothetical protein